MTLVDRLAAVDVIYDQTLAELARCPEREAFALVEALTRQAARLQGLTIRAQVHLAELHPAHPGEGDDLAGDPYSEFLPDELAAALAQSPRGMSDRLRTAWEIARGLPQALAAMTSGALDHARLLALHRLTQSLSDGQRAVVEAQMLAGSRLRSASQWRRKIHRTVQRLDPEAAARRREEARARRGVAVKQLEDGIGLLQATLAAEDTQAIYDRVDQIARADAQRDTNGPGNGDGHSHTGSHGGSDGGHGNWSGSHRDGHSHTGSHGGSDGGHGNWSGSHRDGRHRRCDGDGDASDSGHLGHLGRAGDGRSLDARRADVLAALLLGNRREQVTVEIQVIASVGTLAGLDNNPAELVGFGPIPADVGRALAADARWRRVLTDPESGTVLDLGHRRVPTPALARLVRHQQIRCVFPGCGMPARRCDLDHTLAHAHGGRTALDNLGLLCRHHHSAKHRGRWTLHRERPGVFVWSSPAGRFYTIDTAFNDEEGLPPPEDHRTWSAERPEFRPSQPPVPSVNDVCPF
jgi:hypothetical protein